MNRSVLIVLLSLFLARGSAAQDAVTDRDVYRVAIDSVIADLRLAPEGIGIVENYVTADGAQTDTSVAASALRGVAQRRTFRDFSDIVSCPGGTSCRIPGETDFVVGVSRIRWDGQLARVTVRVIFESGSERFPISRGVLLVTVRLGRDGPRVIEVVTRQWS